MTVPLKPFCDVIEIVPVEPLLPALISGNTLGSLRMKSGFEVTFRVNETVSVEADPATVACRVIVYAPALVPAGTVTLAVIFTGAPKVGFTVAAGVRLHIAFGICVLQETVTLCASDPAAVA